MKKIITLHFLFIAYSFSAQQIANSNLEERLKEKVIAEKIIQLTPKSCMIKKPIMKFGRHASTT